MKLSTIILEIEKVPDSFRELFPTEEEFIARALPVVMKMTSGHLGPDRAREYIMHVYWNIYG